MKEPKPRMKENTDKELVAMESTESPEQTTTTTIEPVTHTKCNICTNVIRDCVAVIVRKRSGNSRKKMYLVLVVIGLSLALEYGSTVNLFNGMSDR